MTREEILKMALDARKQEVMHYQINIDNYTLAIAKISSMRDDDRVELASFFNQLEERLAAEKLEQKKALIMLDVIRTQVEE